MRYYRNIVKNYNLKEEDLNDINAVWETMSKYKDEFSQEMCKYATDNFKIPESHSSEVISEYQYMFGYFFENLLKGNINNDYLNFLTKFSSFNSEYFINQEMFNGLLSYGRRWLHEKIFQNVPDDFRRKGILLSFHKLMDISSDVIVSSYYNEIIKGYSKSFNLRNIIVDISERFSLFMHMILVAILIFLTAAATVYFGIDTLKLLSKETEHVLITSLGSLLIIWVLVELLHTEIQNIKGGKFKISIFVGVALIAFVRDLLILTLKHETNNITTYFVLASILVLGLIYWLIAQQERNDSERRTK